MRRATSLVARLIGYKAAAAPITPGSDTIRHDFVLASNPMALGEVVVTGGGTRTTSEKPGNAPAPPQKPRRGSRKARPDPGGTRWNTYSPCARWSSPP